MHDNLSCVCSDRCAWTLAHEQTNVFCVWLCVSSCHQITTPPRLWVELSDLVIDYTHKCSWCLSQSPGDQAAMSEYTVSSLHHCFLDRTWSRVDDVSQFAACLLLSRRGAWKTCLYKITNIFVTSPRHRDEQLQKNRWVENGEERKVEIHTKKICWRPQQDASQDSSTLWWMLA